MSELLNLHINSNHPSDKWNTYFDYYERHLSHYRGKSITLVEIGVQNGGSLDVWSEYFGPNSRIIGVDIDPACANLKYNKSNIQIVIGNQEDPAFWDQFLIQYPDIHVVVDDGGHTMKQQIVTLQKLFPALPLGGTFICEDTHTSYWPEYDNDHITFTDYAKKFVDVLHYDWKVNKDGFVEEEKNIAYGGLSGLYFYDSLVVFEKFGKRPMHRILSPGKR